MELTTLILAAGLGKRMNSDLPKVLHEVNGKPMVAYCIDLAKELQSQKTVIIVGYKREMVIESTKDYGVEFVIQDQQLGTGHAVQVCEDSLQNVEGDILILYGDVPLLRTETMKKMLDFHHVENAVCTVLTAVLDDPFNYGRIIRDDNGLVTKIVEEKDASETERNVKEINSGIYIFKKKELFDALHAITPSAVTGEYYLTSVFEVFAQQGMKVCAFVAKNADEILGVNNPEQLKAVEDAIKRL